MKRTDADLLHDTLDAVAAIRRHPPASKEALYDDEVLCGFVLRQLEIIGEAVSKLSDATRNLSPATPWRRISGMRNRLIHDYANVDLDVVWLVLQSELDPLCDAAKSILKILEPDE